MRNGLLELGLTVVRTGVKCGFLLGLLVYLVVFVVLLLNSSLVLALLWGTVGAGLLAPLVYVLWLVSILVGFVLAALGGRGGESFRKLNGRPLLAECASPKRRSHQRAEETDVGGTCGDGHEPNRSERPPRWLGDHDPRHDQGHAQHHSHQPAGCRGHEPCDFQ